MSPLSTTLVHLLRRNEDTFATAAGTRAQKSRDVSRLWDGMDTHASISCPARALGTLEHGACRAKADVPVPSPPLLYTYSTISIFLGPILLPRAVTIAIVIQSSYYLALTSSIVNNINHESRSS